MKKVVGLLFLVLLPKLLSAQLTADNVKQLSADLHKHVNDLRASLQLPKLSISDTLGAAAQIHSDFMAANNKLTHTEVKGNVKNPKDRVVLSKGTDFEIVGENVLQTPLPKGKLSKSEVSKLAAKMFELWKNSPGHYQNMIGKDYVFEGFAFSTNKTLTDVYATQVFGRRGIVVPHQLSTNTFNIKKGPDDCYKVYNDMLNIVYSMGNSIDAEGKDIYYSYHDIARFQKIFKGKMDGMAVDVIEKSQFPCHKENVLDMNPVYDGVMLKPVYRDELLKNNQAESPFRLITKMGEIPPHLMDKTLDYSILLIKDGKLCMYLTPYEVDEAMYPLLPLKPTLLDEKKVSFLKKGIIASQEIEYEFQTNNTEPETIPLVLKYKYPVSSVKIKSYSSVEGDSAKNAKLHFGRAESIKVDLSKKLKISNSSFNIDAKENWHKMAFQFEMLGLDSINKYSLAEQRVIVNKKELAIDWDELFYDQRKATATIFYLADLSNSTDSTNIPLLNLYTAILTNKPQYINKALCHLNFRDTSQALVVFEDEIFEVLLKEKKYVQNAAALFAKVYRVDIEKATEFLKTWVNRKDELNQQEKENLLYLYCLIGTELLKVWDLSSEMLSRVIAPQKMIEFVPQGISEDLRFDSELTFIRYYGQINLGTKIGESFNFIESYIKQKNLTVEDKIQLALFYNYWTVSDRSNDLLIPEFQKGSLPEDGIFLLAQTMIINRIRDPLTSEILKKAASMNQKRWCEWMKRRFQILRNDEVKILYCENCN